MICCVIAIWMTHRQIYIFFLNEDTTSVQYKSFSTATENHYPDITICIEDLDPGEQFMDSSLPYNLTSVGLTNILHGAVSDESTIKEGGKNVLEALSGFMQNRNMSFEDLLDTIWKVPCH